MYRKLVIISLLALGFAAILFIHPWTYFYKDQRPSFYDRLPQADLIGRSNVLDLSKSFSKALYYHQSPAREFLSPDFLLSQAKNYGLDFQSSIYFFGNDGEKDYLSDFGLMVMVTDSAKIGDGVKRFSNLINFKDTIIEGSRVFNYAPKKMYITYGEKWLLFYIGNDFISTMKSIKNAKKNDIPADWRTLLNNFNLSRHSIVMRSFSQRLQKRGIQMATVTMTNDTNNLVFQTKLSPFDSVSFKVKEGYQLDEKEFTKRLLNIHIDVDKLKRNGRDPIYCLIKELGSKISFPTESFLDAWDGDVAFRQGGTYLLKEEYIESELDENFNVTEVVKYKEIKISGLSCYIGVNDKGKSFLRDLYRKGIVTNDEDRVRVLFSPPMNLKISDSSLLFYSSNYKPDLLPSEKNNGIWTFGKTAVSFYLDSTTPSDIYGRINVPLDEIMKKLQSED